MELTISSLLNIVIIICCLWLNPSLFYLKLGKQHVEQSPYVVSIWEDVTRCTGREQDLGEIDWYYVENMYRIRFRSFDALDGLWEYHKEDGEEDIKIWIKTGMSGYLTYRTIRHELLHHNGFRHEDVEFIRCELG